MSYPKQQKTIERIENQNLRVIKELRKAGQQHIQALWETTKGIMKAIVRDNYRKDFGNAPWTMFLASHRRTLDKINLMVGHALSDFHQESVSVASRYFREIYRQSVLRNAYLLDMVTPESYKVTLPKNRMFTEAAITTYTGPDADIAWKIRWSSWLAGYQESLSTNLRMGSLNDSTLDDAENEIDATRVGTPSYDVSDALNRIFLSQAVSLQAQAQRELASLNDDMDIEEIWQTSFSARVCDICDDNKGLTRDEADDDIPAHPNCECYWRLVPAAWADLLANGDEDEVDLAKWMDANGKVPGAMIVQNDEGDPVGKVIVTFEDWVAGNPQVVASR